MIQIPAHIITSYTAFITRSGVLSGQHQYYIKWLRYYLDFCHKYNFGQEEESLAAFMDKLKERQAENLRKQARHAVSLFVEIDQCSTEKVKNDIPPVTNTKYGQASTDATHLHAKKSLLDQAVSPAHAFSNSKVAVSNNEPQPSTAKVLNRAVQTGLKYTAN